MLYNIVAKQGHWPDMGLTPRQRKKGQVMKLFHISQTTRGYETFDSAIVAAVDEDAASLIHPNGEGRSLASDDSDSWCFLKEQRRVPAEEKKLFCGRS